MHRVRLLHVEDNQDFRLLVRAALRLESRVSFEVTEAATLTEATELLAKELADLVLLDVHLPDCDSPARSVATLRAIAPLIPVVILTADASLDAQEFARAAGAEGYLLKDAIAPATLIAALHFAASKRQQPDARVIGLLGEALDRLENSVSKIEARANDASGS